MSRVLATAQTIPGEVDTNLAQHLEAARLAAQEGAQLLLFPELSLTGYELQRAKALAFTREDPRLLPLREAASTFGLTMIVGAPVRTDDGLYLAALILAPDQTIDIYTKHHLGAFPASVSPDGIVPPPEASVFLPGEKNPLIQWEKHTAAVAICADVGRPAHAQRARSLGADTYLASMFVIPADLQQDTNRLRTYAAQHRMTVVFSNYGGPTGGLQSAGRSGIWSDEGELLVQLEPKGAQLAVATEGANGWQTQRLDLRAHS